jgi:hypothetical protein
MGIQDDVNDIRARAFARQAMDYGHETIDTVGNTKGRGGGAIYDSSLSEIAESMGLGDTAYPQQNAAKLLRKAQKNFVKNLALFLITETAFNTGMNFDEACEFAAGICIMNKINNVSDVQMLEDWADER